jgi:hypothetical protein
MLPSSVADAYRRFGVMYCVLGQRVREASKQAQHSAIDSGVVIHHCIHDKPFHIFC